MARKPRARARRDPDIELGEAITFGETCPRCLTPTGRSDRKNMSHLGAGCKCSLEERHLLRQLSAEDWVNRNRDNLAKKKKRSNLIADGLPFSTDTRGGRRTGRTEEEVEASRIALLKRVGIEPRYFEPRVQEANHEPYSG